MILQWRRQGKTILAAEHRIAWLWELIDRAVILCNGKIVREPESKEKAALTPEELTGLGLRSTVQEPPASIDLPPVSDGDEALTLNDFHLKKIESGVAEVVLSE